MFGALCYYVTHASPADFQPMKANFGILPPLESKVRDKRQRLQAYVARGNRDLGDFLASLDDQFVAPIPAGNAGMLGA
jgi:methylenetetrahydrofolate--tRNA-(uracil-5-)-methyltransferase